MFDNENREKYNTMQCKLGFTQKVYSESSFGKSEKTYTDNNGKYVLRSEHDLTQEEINNFCMYQQTLYLRTIKRCAVYFTAISIIGGCAYLILTLIQ